MLAGAVAHRETVKPPILAVTGPPVVEKDWRAVAQQGRWLGRTDAPIVLVEFADFECPFCRRFELALQAAQRRFGSKLATVFVHYPLSSHRFAMPAARAAECAARQGRFFEFHDVLFIKQDSLGLKRWESYASEAGIRDSLAFKGCADRADTVSAIRQGLAAGAKLGVHGTPTVMINGFLFRSGLDPAKLDSVLSAAIASVEGAAAAQP